MKELTFLEALGLVWAVCVVWDDAVLDAPPSGSNAVDGAGAGDCAAVDAAARTEPPRAWSRRLRKIRIKLTMMDVEVTIRHRAVPSMCKMALNAFRAVWAAMASRSMLASCQSTGPLHGIQLLQSTVPRFGLLERADDWCVNESRTLL